MIEHWFRSEVEELLKRNGRVVVSDGNGDGAFLMDSLKGVGIVLTAGNTMEEIKCRYEAEKHYKEERQGDNHWGYIGHRTRSGMTDTRLAMEANDIYLGRLVLKHISWATDNC